MLNALEKAILNQLVPEFEESNQEHIQKLITVSRSKFNYHLQVQKREQYNVVWIAKYLAPNVSKIVASVQDTNYNLAICRAILTAYQTEQ